VTLLLKKTGLDTADMSDFWPVSNLSFMSKVVERAVASQLTEYLSANGLLPCLKSAYRKRHLTETAMLRVWSDILMTADVQQVTLLAMLDLSTAFDCVDHTILLQLLQVGAGLTDVVLEWIASFLSERTQQIAYVGELSSLQLVLFGVPQAAFWGRCCTFCTPRSCSTSSLVTDSDCSCMLMTAKCTSVRQLTTPSPFLTASRCVLPISMTK